MSITTSPPMSPKSARRSSRFIEGEPLTFPDLQQISTPSKNLLSDILSEQDAFEKKRKHSGSDSSVESLPSSGHIIGTSPIVGNPDIRRSFGYARPSLDMKGTAPYQVDDKEKAQGDESNTLSKLKGRLRAWTAGARDR